MTIRVSRIFSNAEKGAPKRLGTLGCKSSLLKGGESISNHRYSSRIQRKRNPKGKPDWIGFLNLVLNFIRILLDLLK